MINQKSALNLVVKELEFATVNYPEFKSPHEGYAIILEELDELWTEVRNNNQQAAVEEAIQVAAMAIRFVMDFR